MRKKKVGKSGSRRFIIYIKSNKSFLMDIFSLTFMFDVECPTPAYERLKNAGLIDRILEKREIIHYMFLYNYPFPEKEEKRLIGWAQKVFFDPNRGISDRSEVARDILELTLEYDQKEDSFHRLDKVREDVIHHPSVLARIVLGDDVFGFRQYGFPSRRSLEEAIASFCVGEYSTIMGWGREEHVWRNGNNKNRISLNMHGDLYASQVDVSDPEDPSFFGEMLFDAIKKEAEAKAIHAYQDWSDFLIASLRYAQAIGKARIPEIVNWRGVLKETGAVGTNTAEAMFGSGGMDPIPWLMERPILRSDTQPTDWPICVTYHASEGIYFLPYVDMDTRRLLYLAEDKNGDIEFPLGRFSEGKKYSVRINWDEEDLPHILRATYRFFARDKSLLPRIMDSFLREVN